MLRYLILILAFNFSLPSQIHAQIEGFWKTTFEGEEYCLDFDSSGFVSFIFEGDTFSKEGFLLEDIMVYSKYELNDSGDIFHLDFTINNVKNHKELSRHLTICKFDKKGRLVLFVFETNEETRPTRFLEENTLVFNRQKKTLKDK